MKDKKPTYKDIFATTKQAIENESGNLESVKASNLESVKSSNLETETLVNLGVKIPAAHRNYWNSKAAAAGLSMKSILIAALEEKLGKPE
jgi:hypothetical protein